MSSNQQLSVLECVDNATLALEHQDNDKALGLLQDSKAAIDTRMKLIKFSRFKRPRLANRSRIYD